VTDYRRVLKNDYVKTAIAIALIIAIVLGFFFGLGLALGTSVPVRVVESGSMCTEIYGCDGWSHPFEQTLHVGDIIIIQSVNPEELSTDYPNSDIIVYQNPNLRGNPEATPIVHRIVAKYQVNGTWYFQTKGDGNGVNWPTTPTTSEYDSHTLWSTGEGVPEDLVLGKVVMRIPYFGWITLFMRDNSWALPLVIGLIMLLIVIEFILPIVRTKNRKKQAEQEVIAMSQP
jgi:signal peptidase I